MSTKILMVEDSPTQAEALRAHLESANYDVELASEGEAALEKLANGGFDLVISDIMMPGEVDGYELCRRIKAESGRDLPVVLLTSLSDPLDIIRGLECGADNFLTKPYQPRAFLERIDLLLRNRRLRASDRLRTGVKIFFMGREFVVTSEREQILDLLVTTFEQAVRQNRELRDREAELERAKAELTRYAGALETELERLFDLSLDLICIAGFDGYFKRLNPAWQRWLGWSDAELKARPLLEFVHPDDRPATVERLQSIVAGAAAEDFVNRYRCLDGSYRWLEWRSIPIAEEGTIFAIARDVTERKQAEAALHASEERYRLLFERHPRPLWVFDRETLRFLAVNDAAVDHYGYSREEFLASTIEAIRPAEDVPAVRKAVARGARIGRSSSLWRHRTKDGTLIDVEVTAHDLDFLGRPARLVAVVDVTERQRALRALEAQARQQAAVARLGRLAVETPTPAELAAAACPVVAETLGVELVHLLDRPGGGAALVLRAEHGWPPASLGGVAVRADAATREGWALAHDAPVVVEDSGGESRFADGHAGRDLGTVSGACVVVPTKGRPFGVLGVESRAARAFSPDDVHFLEAVAHILGTAIDRDRAEQAVRHAQRLESVGRLASGVAHDFNNLLSVILGETELAWDSLAEGHPARAALEEAASAGKRASGLTRQLLAFARQEVVDPVLLDLNQVVREVDKMLLRLIGADIERVTQLAPDLGAVRIDPVQLEQVLVNLVVNARDAMPEGGVLTIETSSVSVDAELAEQRAGPPAGEYALLTVSDTGVGMSPEVRQHVFEPFFTTKSSGQGTGLGLATCYGIVQQAGGHIQVYSEPGIGTTFRILLPRVAGAAAARAAAAPQATRGSGQSILLVEDEPGVRTVASRMLEKRGFRVTTAADGEEALAMITDAETVVDLLLTDLVMPKMSGRALVERARELRPELRVLYASGYTDDDTVRRSLRERRDPIVSKPFTTETLARKVLEALDAGARDERADPAAS